MNTITNNTTAILSDLSEVIQKLDTPDLLYTKSTTVPAYIASLGIRSLIKNTTHAALAYSFQYATTNAWQATPHYQWSSYKKEPIIDDLKAFLSSCRVIAFADWSNINGASDLWDGLRRDVIKPLQKRDFEFVFYLGYLANKLSYEVDEILDIISDFSIYGKVTLVLDKGEADKLWMVLNGYDANKPLTAMLPPGPEERFRSIFNTMNIYHLLVYTADRILSFTRQDRTEIIDRVHTNVGIVKYVRNNFNAGYSLGLQLELELLQCTAFGLAMAGSYRETGITPNRNALLSYIKKWIAAL